jgi:hypothetical protein
MSMKHHHSQQAQAAIAAARAIEKARRGPVASAATPTRVFTNASPGCTKPTLPVLVQRAAVEQIFHQMNARGSFAQFLPGALDRAVPRVLHADRGETLASLQARLLDYLAISRVQRPPTAPGRRS